MYCCFLVSSVKLQTDALGAMLLSLLVATSHADTYLRTNFFCFTGFHSRLYITCQCLNIQHLNLIALKLCLRLAAWYKWQTVRFRRSEMNRLCMKRPLESGKSCPGSAVVLWPSQAGVRFCRPFPAFNKRYSVAGPSLASVEA